MNNKEIIRRVDDLGRIIIPKIFRNKLNIEEGNPMEVILDIENQSIIFKKINTEENKNDINK